MDGASVEGGPSDKVCEAADATASFVEVFWFPCVRKREMVMENNMQTLHWAGHSARRHVGSHPLEGAGSDSSSDSNSRPAVL